MLKTFHASLYRDRNGYSAQCLEVDIVSQGATKEAALANLKEAVELYFEPPQAHPMPEIHAFEVDLAAAETASVS
ncbi:MAG: type II toxin-antitoxin system HicB family antitoxin [Candidatus Omnitrophota bacterium]